VLPGDIKNFMTLPPPIGTWIDDLPEPLHTEADVKDLFEPVGSIKAKFAAKSCDAPAHHSHGPATE
jgi:hypothetical protein